MKSRALFLLALAWGLPCQSVALPEGDLQHQEKADVVFRTLAGWPSNTFDFHNGIYYRFTDSSTGPSNPSDGSRHGIFEMVGLVAQGNVVLSTAGIQEITLLQFKTPTQGPTFYWGGYSLKNTSIPRGLAASPGSTRSAIIATAKSLKNRPVPINYILSPGQAIFPDIYYNYITTSGAGGQFLDVDEIQAMRSDTFTEYCYAANNLQIVRYGSVFLLAEVAYLQTLAAHGGLSPRRQLEYLRASTIDYPAITVFNGTTTVANGGATFLTSLNIRVEDALSGPERLEFSRNGSTIAIVNLNDTTRETTSYLYTSSDISELGSLQNAQYSVRAIDQAGNVTSGAFDIDTDSMPTPIPMNTRHGGLGDYANSTNTVVGRCTGTSSGVCGFNLSGPSFTSSRTFASAASAEVGPFRGLSQGTYTLTCTNCAGTSSAKPFFYSTASVNNFALVATSPQTTHTDSRSVDVSKIADRDSTRLLLKVKCSKDAATWCKESTAGVACEMMQLTVEGGEVASCGCSGFCNELRSEILLMPQSVSFQVKNTTLTASDFGVTVYAAIYKYGAYEEAISTAFAPGSQFQLSPGGVMVGSVAVQEVTPSYISSSPVSSMDAPIAQISVSSVGSCDSIGSAAPRQQLWRSSTCQQYFGSDVAFVVNSTVTFTYADSGGQPAVATSTLKVYQWTGSSWTTSGISQIGVSISTPPSVIIASATLARSGIYAMLFSVADTSAPTTSWSIEGSSSGFAGITFVSTYSYLVLSSTDPTVDGFASGLATTYYRIDGLPGDAYSVYSTSLSFLPGTHWVDSYAEDYAGNVSSVTRATITVTAGSVTNLSGDLQVDGNLLVGFLGSGAKAEVVARAEYDYALLVSSVDGRAMLAVDNANFVSIGTAPASGRLTLAGVAGDTALALRSGNSTAAVTGAQLAFGYDGTGELRHRLYTQHGSAANLNKLVFALWTPAAGSSATLGGLPVLSLEGSTITAANALAHVMPAGVADKELVVSNGSAMGEGDVLRWERWVPSASILKKDIRRLGRADEERAWADVAALKPVAFRRKTAAPEAALERGYIYEETPLSIRDGPGAASVDERLVNAELALKAAMRRIGELKGRIRKLKERGR